MAFTRYASFEVSEILDIKGARDHSRVASLDKLSDFEDYRTQDGYLYARIRAISSRVNKNHDGWPSVELAGSPEVFNQHTASEGGFVVNANRDNEYGFSTFLGKPIFVDHNNSNPERARGVIVDAKLHVEDHKTAAALDSYYASAPDNHMPPTWVELLLEIDAKAFPKFAKAIIDGSKNSKKGIDGFSMGCDVERSVCNICKNSATSPDQFCNHVKMKGAHFDYIDKDGHKTSKRSYEDCHGIKFFEISGVFDPADETALTREIIASVQHESQFGDELYPDQYAQQRDDSPNGLYAAMCPHCNGEGIDEQTGERCPICSGRGVLQPGVPGGDGAYAPEVKYNPLPQGMNAGPVHQGALPLEDNHYRLQGHTAHTHVAENPEPQSDLINAPMAIDTLREEKICPVCGSNMDDETCEVCGYVEPPDGFDNPDLERARDTDLGQDAQDDQDREQRLQDMGADYGNSPVTTPISSTFAAITNGMDWELTHPKVAGQINQIEKPVLTTQRPATNEPKDVIIKDQAKPVTSSVRTADDFIAAAGATNRRIMDHEAEAASGAPAVASPDQRVDVTGTGGVMDASNDAASRADAQVNVDAIGGTGVEGVGAEKENVNVEQGNEHSRNIESIHTDTWNGTKDQQSPVTNEVFEGNGAHSSGWVVSDVHGVDPADPMFKADERIDVTGGDPHSITTEDSGPTRTWTGTGGNGVTRQQDPVTDVSSQERQNSDSWSEDPGTHDYARGDRSSHIFTAFKLADLEIDLGLLAKSAKYERVSELEKKHPQEVIASLEYAQRVRKANVVTSKRVASLPPMGRKASTEHVASETKVTDKGNVEDSALFM